MHELVTDKSPLRIHDFTARVRPLTCNPMVGSIPVRSSPLSLASRVVFPEPSGPTTITGRVCQGEEPWAFRCKYLFSVFRPCWAMVVGSASRGSPSKRRESSFWS